MVNFKVGDSVKRVSGWCPSVGLPAGGVGIVSVLRGTDFVEIEGYGDFWHVTKNLELVTLDDELPPAPESVQYREEDSAVGTFGHLLVQPSIEGPSLYIEVYAEQYSSGKSAYTGIRIEPDAALQLCHDLRRMAMSIKKKEKNNA
ncbi:hypothetical protein [Pectobacterium phage Ekidair]|uniref:Uncharacterized protein n=1 Tax=Pectobacterium phage Ekidair TaxID=2489626 RepID=A0A3G8FKX0_9CAUD|nr:hypothetical protein [Pectobacterium phage Ekidair]